MKTVFKAIVSYSDYDAYDSEGLFSSLEKATEWTMNMVAKANEATSAIIEEIELDTNKCLICYDILNGGTL